MKKLLTLLLILALLPSVLAVYGGGDVPAGGGSSGGGGGGGGGGSSTTTVAPVATPEPCASGVTCGADCCLIGEKCHLGGCMSPSLIAMLDADLLPDPEPEPVVEAEPEPEATGPSAITGTAVETLEESPISVAVLWTGALLALAVLIVFYIEHHKK